MKARCRSGVLAVVAAVDTDGHNVDSDITDDEEEEEEMEEHGDIERC